LFAKTTWVACDVAICWDHGADPFSRNTTESTMPNGVADFAWELVLNRLTRDQINLIRGGVVVVVSSIVDLGVEDSGSDRGWIRGRGRVGGKLRSTGSALRIAVMFRGSVQPSNKHLKTSTPRSHCCAYRLRTLTLASTPILKALFLGRESNSSCLSPPLLRPFA
jgi:hypothetical protein